MGKVAGSNARAFECVMAFLFVWGAGTSVNDVLVPAVKSISSLTDTQARDPKAS